MLGQNQAFSSLCDMEASQQMEMSLENIRKLISYAVKREKGRSRTPIREVSIALPPGISVDVVEEALATGSWDKLYTCSYNPLSTRLKLQAI